MNKERGIICLYIICLYKVVKKDDPTSVILIEHGEEGKSIAMFKDPAVKPLIEGLVTFMTQISYQATLINSRSKLEGETLIFRNYN